METITIDSDVKVFYIIATSFPAGIMDAHKRIYELTAANPDRKYYGLSRGNHGEILYMAAAEELSDGEGEKLGCETLVLKKGTYVSETIKDFMKNIPAIGSTFQQMLSLPNIDQNGYCVEYYFNDKDVQCMVKLGD